LPKWISWLAPYFRNVENLHIVCWLGKDTAWAKNIQSMWVVFMVPTVVLAFIFVVVFSCLKHQIVNNITYMIQFMWVGANLVWAYGELFLTNDDPLYLFDFSPISKDTMRWYSSWLLFCSFLLAALKYMIWIPCTIGGCTVEQTTGVEEEN